MWPTSLSHRPMIDYRAPLDDILFALRHGAGAARLPGWDDETARQVLTEAGRFIEGEIAPLDVVADRTPARLEYGRVRVAPKFVAAYGRYREGGWPALSAGAAYGGQDLPDVVAGAVTEMLAGACISFQMILSLAQGAIHAIVANGSPSQRERYLPPLVSGEWLATMCLTEAQAGSDLSRVRTLAQPAGGGRYRLTGAKIFISGGDHDMARNIVHLVLARTPDAAPGVKGLSLFLCPALLPDGGRNAIACLRLEEKMGLHASPTCQLAFDGAEAEMLGGEGEGLARMFVMMNAVRLDTGMQGVGLAEVAGQRARAYAAERIQGRCADARGAVAINRHADVRRMLLTQIALAQGCRALLYRTRVELELGRRPELVDFLTPVCKAFATDAGVEAAQLAIQVHGGYGYLREYRVEQILRDARITTIYEGTNGIHAVTLAERLLRQRGGACAAAFREEIAEARAAASAPTAAALADALERWDQAAAALGRRPGADAAATSFLRLTALLAVAAAWSRLEAAAEHAPNPARTRAAAAFFRDAMLPECASLAQRIVQPLEFSALAEEVFE